MTEQKPEELDTSEPLTQHEKQVRKDRSGAFGTDPKNQQTPGDFSRDRDRPAAG